MNWKCTARNSFILVWTSQTQHLTRWTFNQDPAEGHSALLVIPHSVPSLEGHRITWLPEQLTRGAAVLLALGGSCISKAGPWPAGCCCRRSRTSAHSDRRHFENPQQQHKQLRRDSIRCWAVGGLTMFLNQAATHLVLVSVLQVKLQRHKNVYSE